MNAPVRQLKLRHLFTLGFGTIIGVGWITALGTWLEQAGSLGAVAAFAIGAVLILLVAVCYAEMAALVPLPGGEIAYARVTVGEHFSFFVGWFLGLVYVGTAAFEAISVGWICTQMFPQLAGSVLYRAFGEEVTSGSLAIGAVSAILIGWCNSRSALAVARFQDAMTYALIGVTLLFVVAGIALGDPSNLKPYFVSQRSNAGVWPGILSVLVTAPFWYAGFNVIPQAVAERGEQVSLRLVGIVIALVVVSAGAFYCLIIIASAMVLPRTELLEHNLPAAGAFAAAFRSQTLGQVALIAGLLGLITTWNAVAFAAVRIVRVLLRADVTDISRKRAESAHGAPGNAVAIVTLLTVILLACGKGALLPIVNAIGACFAGLFLFVSLAVVRMRRTGSADHRPLRVPHLGIVSLLATLLSVGMLVISFREHWLQARGGLPTEWALLAGWAILGAITWSAVRSRGRARPLR